MIKPMLRILMFGMGVSLWAQGPDLDHARSNVWLFPPQIPGFRVEKVVASGEGLVYAGTPQGLFSLRLGDYVRVPGLPEEAVLDLQLLDGGSVGVRFSTGSFAVGLGDVKKISGLPAKAQATGSIDWGGFLIQIRPMGTSTTKRPIYDLLVRRKSDSTVLVDGKGIEVDQSSYWSPVSKAKAIFAVSGHWLMMDARTGRSEYLSLQLPHRALDHFVDEQRGRLYLALNGEGIGSFSIGSDSIHWKIRPEAANVQLMQDQLWVAHSNGFSRLEKRPYRKDGSLLLEPKFEREVEGFVNQPDWTIEDAEEALRTKGGITIAIPRNGMPLYRRDHRPWQKIGYESPEVKELPARWVAESDDGRVWAAAKHGLLEIIGLSVEKPQLKRVGTDLGRSYISEFKRDREGTLWLLGEGFWAKYEQGEWRKQTAPDCMISPKFRSFALRSENEVWIAYRNSAPVTRVIRAANGWTCQHYGPEEGNVNLETNAVAVDRRGWVWMMGETANLAMNDAATGMAWPKNVQHVVVLPQNAYLPTGDAHWHGFVDEGPDTVAMLIGKSLVRLNRRIVEELYSKSGQLKLSKAGDASYRIDADSILPPELAYSIRWRWIDSSGKGLSTFASQKSLELSERPNGAAAVEVLSPAGQQILPDPFRVDSGQLVWLLLLLPVAGLYLGRWHLVALLGAPSLLRKVERRLFLRLRDQAPGVREAELAKLPMVVRNRVQMLLQHFDHVESNEDERTRSGLILDQHYLLEHVIAKGGFATVYLAQDVKDGGSVAVKLFQQPAREGSWLAKRLAGEIESMQRLQHPSVVKLLHHGLGPDERPYLVMEYIHGVTLRQSLRQGSIEAGRAVRIISQTLSALEEVHRQGILHRDLKPENIVLRNAGTADEVAMLIDFGVATVYEEILDGQKSTYFAGSLDYVSPEQVAGLKLEASDVFSMGAVCFEILSGCRLKLAVGQGDGETVILEKLQLAGVARPREVAAVLVNATAIEHSRRTAKIRDFKTDLLDALSG
jgi:hypothetical protein